MFAIQTGQKIRTREALLGGDSLLTRRRVYSQKIRCNCWISGYPEHGFATMKSFYHRIIEIFTEPYSIHSESPGQVILHIGLEGMINFKKFINFYFSKTKQYFLEVKLPSCPMCFDSRVSQINRFLDRRILGLKTL